MLFKSRHHNFCCCCFLFFFSSFFMSNVFQWFSKRNLYTIHFFHEKRWQWSNCINQWHYFVKSVWRKQKHHLVNSCLYIQNYIWIGNVCLKTFIFYFLIKLQASKLCFKYFQNEWPLAAKTFIFHRIPFISFADFSFHFSLVCHFVHRVSQKQDCLVTNTFQYRNGSKQIADKKRNKRKPKR